MKTIYLGLGSNLGDRKENLERALRELHANGVRILRRSSLYETAPQDFLDQPWFLNIVVEAETELMPRQLLASVQRVEARMGRRRHRPKGPRNIDVDILLYGDVIIDTPDLTIPHPGLQNRRFVLEPLAELSAELPIPSFGMSVRALLGQVGDQDVKRIDSTKLP